MSLFDSIAPSMALLVPCGGSVKGVNTSVAPTTQQRCNTGRKSGGYGVTRTEHELGTIGGRFTFTYDTLLIPDSVEVLYEGRVIFTTGGAVDTNGDRTTAVAFGPGKSTKIMVVVTGTYAATQWDYTVACPD